MVLKAAVINISILTMDQMTITRSGDSPLVLSFAASFSSFFGLYSTQLHSLNTLRTSLPYQLKKGNNSESQHF